MRQVLFLFLLTAFSILSCAEKEEISMKRNQDPKYIKDKLAKYTPVRLEVNRDVLTDNQFEVLKHLAKAAKSIDIIFWQQSYRDALAIKKKLEKSDEPIDQHYLQFLKINYGPFDRQSGFEPFIGNMEHPLGAGFYPQDITKTELETYVQNHPEQKDELYSTYTIVKRKDNKLVAVAYEEEYRSHLEEASQYLQKAAELTKNQSLKKYLNLRAKALASGDYFESNMAWMELKDNLLDIVIGPIETYEDQLMGLKAAYEGIVIIKDKKETQKLELYKEYMNQLEANLPVPRLYKKAKATPRAPIGVYNTIYTSGDARAGVKSIAFSLPNDEKVRELKGARTVQQKNIILAKFNKILMPIAKRVLKKDVVAFVDGQAFFTNTLMHELAHPLGLNYVRDQNGITVREALKETYSPIEEAKADVVGLYNIGYYVRRGVLEPDFELKSYVTFLASIFRSVRFGAEAAHAKANMITFNYLVREKGIVFDPNSDTYSINFKRMKTAIKKLASDLLMIEGDGDYQKATKWLTDMAQIPPQMQQLLDNLSDIPIDLEFKFDPILFQE